MLSLTANKPASELEILCLGAHCDDIEIGAGGMVMDSLARYPQARVTWVVLSSNESRREEALAAAGAILEHPERHRVEIQEFRNGYFPFVGAALKDYFEELKKSVRPDLILTHSTRDAHQDHRTVGELTWNTFRDHFILEYEIPKYDGDLSSRPNFYVPLSQPVLDRKLDVITQCFPSQQHRPWFTRSTFEGLMRLRGVECNAPSGYAEAFHARKVLWGGSPISETDREDRNAP